MTPFTVLTGRAAPLMRDNVDTDAIIPSREMRTVSKTGFADGLFAGWRYYSVGSRTADPAFVLNRPERQGVSVLITGDNFGCGSSREHAVWALAEFGFRAIVAPSFNPIFRANCVANGLLPVSINRAAVDRLAAMAEADPSLLLTFDLPLQEIRVGEKLIEKFEIDPEARDILLSGLDPIARTLRSRDQILAFIELDKRRRPWIYSGTAVGPSDL